MKPSAIVRALGLCTGLGLLALAASAETLTVVRAVELKADRYLDAPTLQMLNVGQAVESTRSEAGWVQVRAAGALGWVRAMALKGESPAGLSGLSTLESGRSGRNNSMSTTGIRSIPKASRHALIIGIGEYSAKGIMPLRGVRNDMQSAQQMARAMSIPDENMVYLRDQEATAERIRQALQDLDARVRPGDRVFVYYSGHGTRWIATQDADHCTEGLLSSDGQALSNSEVSQLLSPIANKTDKLMVFYDACHSGGIANQPLRTRSLLQNDGATLTPKFVGNLSPELCAKPSNLRTRSISGELGNKGVLPDNIVSIAASRPDEVSFDDPRSGGLATVAWRDCMLGKARDRDGNGLLNVAEITQCAQDALSQRLRQFPDILGQNMTVGGNQAFIPSYATVASADPAVALSAVAPAAPAAPAAAPVVVTPPLATAPAASATPVSAEPALPQAGAGSSPADMLMQVHAQRDARRSLQVQADPAVLRIGRDPLNIRIQSPQSGYVYVALAGSDGKSLYLLYPNALDGNNRIEAGQSLTLPRPGWRITAGGPEGVDTLLVMVTDSARDLSGLSGESVGPFLKPLLNREGRSQLQTLLGLSGNSDEKVCQQGGRQRNLEVQKDCSDSFASALLRIEERQAP